MQHLAGVSFVTHNGQAAWEGGDGAVYAFITIHCPNAQCNGDVAFSPLYTGTFMLGGAFRAVEGNPLDDYANGGDPSQSAEHSERLRPKGDCPNCGAVYRLTKPIATQVLERAIGWSAPNTPYKLRQLATR